MLFCDEMVSTAIFPGIFLCRPDIVIEACVIEIQNASAVHKDSSLDVCPVIKPIRISLTS